MGLGPPVCVSCKRPYDYVDSKEKLDELRKTRPEAQYWWCSKCGKSDTRDHAWTIGEELTEEIYPKWRTEYIWMCTKVIWELKRIKSLAEENSASPHLSPYSKPLNEVIQFIEKKSEEVEALFEEKIRRESEK